LAAYKGLRPDFYDLDYEGDSAGFVVGSLADGHQGFGDLFQVAALFGDFAGTMFGPRVLDAMDCMDGMDQSDSGEEPRVSTID
jgi:outer membrane lipoprotein SlyB